MVEVVARARWFARGMAEGTGGTEATFFEDRSGSRARSDRWAFAPEQPAGSTYLRDGLLVLGVVAVGLLLGRRSTRGGASTSPSSHAGGTGAEATGRTTPEPAAGPAPLTPEPAAVPAPPSEPARRPADGPGAGAPALRRPAPQDAVPPTPPSSAAPPRPGRST